MAIITPDLNRRLIETARLPALRQRRTRSLEDRPPLEIKEADPQTLVAGSALIVAAENVPAQTREDLINCTLFAQLAASGEVPDSRKIMPWYDAYFRRLRILGWAQSDYRFQDYKFSGKHAEAHKAIEKVLMALLGPQAAALLVIQAALKGLQEMSENSPWLTLFDQQSKVEKGARFQVATAQVGPGGLLQTALAAFHLKARSKFTQVLFFRFSSSSTSMRYASGIATIQESALADTRKLIADQLSLYRRQMVADVKFPPLARVAQPRSLRRRGGSSAPARAPARAVRPGDLREML
jgi:hypothetical protein